MEHDSRFQMETYVLKYQSILVSVENSKLASVLIYLFKLHITPIMIWVKQSQYKSMQTYKRKTTQT